VTAAALCKEKSAYAILVGDWSYEVRYSLLGSSAWADSPATGNKTATLTVPATADRNGNKYRCVVTDKYGNTVKTNTVTLTIV
jgi:Tfp pilus assembly protein PilZ